MATEKELQQLHGMKTFKPINANTLTYDEKQKVIASFMFFIKKCDGSIKASTDERKQHAYTEKMETASPMVMTESILTTAAINAKEG